MRPRVVKPVKPIDPYSFRHKRRLPELEMRSTERLGTLRELGELYRLESPNERAERTLLERELQKKERELTNQSFPWPDVMRDVRNGKTHLLWTAAGSLEAVGAAREQIYALNHAFAAAMQRTNFDNTIDRIWLRSELRKLDIDRLLETYGVQAMRDPLDVVESKLMVSLSEKQRLDAFRAVLQQPEFRTLSPRMKLYLTRVAAGYDMRQAEAFADLVYARALLEHGRYSELIQLADALPSLLFQPTSSHVKQLRASVDCLGFIAKGKSGSYDPLALFADYVMLHARQEHAGAEKYSNEALDLLTKNAEKAIRNLSGMTQWQRAAKNLGIVGFADAPEHTHVFVKPASLPGKIQLTKRLGFDGIRFDKKTGKVVFLTSAGAAQAFLEHCYRTTKEYSTAEFTLAAAFGYEGGYRVHASGKTFRVSAEEWAMLQAGTPLPTEHPITAHMQSQAVFALYSHPLAEGEPRFHREIDAFAFALRKAYPEARIVKDDLTKDTVAKAAQLVAHKVKLRELVIIAADKGFRVTDWNVVNNAWVRLKDRGMNLKRFGPGDKWTDGSGKDVIVITGHSNEKLAEYVRVLGEAGVFRGNYVIFNACETPLTSRLTAEINSRYGAMGTHAYEGKIPYEGVRDMLLAIGSELDAGKTELELDRWWREMVRRQQMNGVWMICRLWGGHAHA
ncbi:MAG TPA: hypothetical protein VF883_03000 [Thermoanaerobaculia bacterium]